MSLHDAPSRRVDGPSGLKLESLGLEADCSRRFLEWLENNPHDVVITNDVSHIHPAFPYFPATTRHIVQVHDSGRRYRRVAEAYQAHIDGVSCVGSHIVAPLEKALHHAGFRGLLRAIHNGATYPPLNPREPAKGTVRLLFVGRVDALKGVFDFLPILSCLRERRVPVSLNLVGGQNPSLLRSFARHGLASMVTWSGQVTHEECYDIASRSDVLVVPSRKEAFGMATVEAMSMGCVPIAYDFTSGSREIIEHGRSGILVPLGDFDAFAGAIEALHVDRGQLGMLSAMSIERSRAHFSSDVMARNWVQFMEDILAHSALHPPTRLSGSPPPGPAVNLHASQSPLDNAFSTLRGNVRDRILSNPRLAHWLLSRT